MKCHSMNMHLELVLVQLLSSKMFPISEAYVCLSSCCLGEPGKQEPSVHLQSSQTVRSDLRKPN